MLSLRLSKELEKKVEALSKRVQISKSDVVREAIEQYIVSQEAALEPSLLGEDLWGNHGSADGDHGSADGDHGSADGDLSVTYKKRLKEKLHEKMPH